MFMSRLPLGPALRSCQCLRTAVRGYSTAVGATTSSSASLGSGLSVSSAPAKRSGNLEMKTYKPRTPGLRHLRRPINKHLWKGGPVRSLTIAKKGQARGGRNNTGQVTVRHRGGGHKRRIRIIDFVRSAPGKQTVQRIEYDPNRSAHLALLKHNVSGERSYIVAADGMRSGDVLESFRAGITKELMAAMGGIVDLGMLAALTVVRGNCLPLHMIPAGTQVYNVGTRARQGGVFCRSAGTYAVVVSKEMKNKKTTDVIIKLQSGEVRKVSPDACATIGVSSNPYAQFAQLGKAGRSRWLGIRPTVRGLAMNAADHPHGGGRGKSKGNRIPVSPWGVQAKSGYKTRRKRNPNKYLVHDRPRNQGKRRTSNN